MNIENDSEVQCLLKEALYNLEVHDDDNDKQEDDIFAEKVEFIMKNYENWLDVVNYCNEVVAFNPDRYFRGFSLGLLAIATRCIEYNQPHEAYMLLFAAKNLILNHNIRDYSDLYERNLGECLGLFGNSTVVGERVFLSIMQSRANNFIDQLNGAVTRTCKIRLHYQSDINTWLKIWLERYKAYSIYLLADYLIENSKDFYPYIAGIRLAFANIYLANGDRNKAEKELELAIEFIDGASPSEYIQEQCEKRLIDIQRFKKKYHFG